MAWRCRGAANNQEACKLTTSSRQMKISARVRARNSLNSITGEPPFWVSGSYFLELWSGRRLFIFTLNGVLCAFVYIVHFLTGNQSSAEMSEHLTMQLSEPWNFLKRLRISGKICILLTALYSGTERNETWNGCLHLFSFFFVCTQ